MKTRYNPASYENKWIDQWDQEQTNATKETSEKKTYVLVMFPYPSGAGLHVGHARVYTGTDVIARYHRMKGESVLYPMGWDAFGLPAENAAIKAKKNPIDMVPDNIANFKRQMKSIGLAYDWNKEFSTTDPQYYKWTQWLFIEMFKMGLLYKKDTAVYFCEFCKTGIAEEEVLPDGTHERCGNPITRKILPQWIFKITAYADDLLKDLEGLDWPPGILAMQKKWIGRKEGMEINFKVSSKKLDSAPDSFSQASLKTAVGSPSESVSPNFSILTVTTSRWETIYGATFLVLAPEHHFIQELIKSKKASSELSDYVKTALSKTDQKRLEEGGQKTGVFTGSYAINPLTEKEVPIWVADYVLSDVGTGAVMGVPAHDVRDNQFATNFNLNSLSVIDSHNLLENSNQWNGKDIKAARNEISEFIEKNNIGKKVVTHHLRDWIFSRQRYWGEPIPMIYCQACAKLNKNYFTENKEVSKDQTTASKDIKTDDNSMSGWFPILEQNLPLELPYVKNYEPSVDGSSPLSQIPDFVKTICPNCAGPATRETDTMPNWAGSCWYFLAFPGWDKNSDFSEHPSLKTWQSQFGTSIQRWSSVDWYIGGAEHAVLHLLYSRFWVKALKNDSLLGFTEPFKRLRSVGMVIAEDHRKMSKSFGNVINPDDVIAEYGADTLRVYEMFMAPFSSDIAWSTAALQGAYRFLTRIWQIYTSTDRLTDNENEEDNELVSELQKVIIKVESDITDVKFNTAISTMMTFLNMWESKPDRRLMPNHAQQFLQILAPFAPFISEELWRDIYKKEQSIHLSTWPMPEEIKKSNSVNKIVIQINGKFRAIIESDLLDQESIVKAALSSEKIKKHINDSKYEVLYIEGKVLNFILK